MTDIVKIHARVEVSPSVLENVKKRCKEIVKSKGLKMYQVDPADMVGELISKFLMENDFSSYAESISNYPEILREES